VAAVTRMDGKIFEKEPKEGSILINAIYFMDKWIFPFNEGDTRMKFRTMDGVDTNVKMMTHKRQLRIAKHGNMTAVNMLYKTPGMGAWFVKNSGDSGYAHDVAYTTLDSFIQQEFVDRTLKSSYQPLHLNIPKFEMNESINLKTLFQGLAERNITEIFKTGRLTRMTNDAQEFFSLFRQDCILKVDQKGTKAVAISIAGTTRGGGSRPKIYNVTFAHTFYMLIYHNDTILFTAKVGCPNDKQNDDAQSTSNPPVDDVPDTVNGAISSHFSIQEREIQIVDKFHYVNVSVNGQKMLMKLTTKQHDGRDDKEGTDIQVNRIEDQIYEGQPPVRRYTVDSDLHIRVTIQFQTPTDISDEESDQKIGVQCVYISKTGQEEPEDIVVLRFGEPYEMPFPLQKEKDEDEDGWNLKDGEGNLFMKLRFRLPDEL
jgi:hypothetical protein